MSRGKAILLAVVILIVAVSVPASADGAQLAEPRAQAPQVHTALSICERTPQASSEAVPMTLSELFQPRAFLAPIPGGTCRWIGYKLLYCSYPDRYCYTYYSYTPPMTCCFPKNSGW